MSKKPTYEELEQRIKKLEKKVGKQSDADKELDKYQFMIESAHDAIFFKDLESHYIIANNKTLETFGLPREDVIGKNDYELMPDKKEAKKNVNDDQIVFKSAKPTEITKHMTGANGKKYWFQAIKVPQFDNNGKVIGLVGIARDITQQKQTAEALRESNRLNELLLDSLPHPAMLIHRDRSVLAANHIAREAGAVVGDYCWRSFAQSEYISNEHKLCINKNQIPADGTKCTFCLADEAFAKNEPTNDPELNAFGALWDVCWIPIDDDAYLHYAINITSRKELENKLRQAHKIEAIGTLSGGIAHDFNNLMMGMLGNISLILHDIEPSHPHYEMLKHVEKLIQSGSKLTSQLLGFARKGKYEVKPISLNRIVKESSETFGRTRKEITIKHKLAEKSFAVEVDETQIQQVLWNLYINAADSMPGGGNLLLHTMNVAHTEMKDKQYYPKPGNYVMIKVMDQGAGMDEKTMERIFDPFFTTKEMGCGTGLGLASAYGIIKAHGGYIDVDSKKGYGTTFNVYLPASDEELTESPIFSKQIEKGDKTILLVDDEEMVLYVGVKMLEKLGYVVLEANSGQESIDIYKENQEKIDLVILDMIMPGIGGGEAFDKMKEINPDVNVFLSSGYSVEGKAQKILDRGCKGFLQKPFNLEELSEKMREFFDKD
jgi:PAS domain S-box-containing protein